MKESNPLLMVDLRREERLIMSFHSLHKLDMIMRAMGSNGAARVRTNGSHVIALQLLGVEIIEEDIKPFVNKFGTDIESLSFLQMCLILQQLVEEDLRLFYFYKACKSLDPTGRGAICAREAAAIGETLIRINVPGEPAPVMAIKEAIWKNSSFVYKTANVQELMKIIIL
jgi:hypothetical protein